MTRERDIERVLDTWFADGPVEAPDRVVDGVAGRIARQGQRPAWRSSERELHVTTPIKVLLAAAAVIALAIGSLAFVYRPAGQVGGPPAAASPTPAPTPVPSPTVAPSPTSFACSDGTDRCAGPLAAGEHSTVSFEPAFSFTTPADWSNLLDIARTYTLAPAPHVFDLQVLSHLAIPDQDAACSPVRKAGAGNAVADWVEFITTHPGLEAGAPQPVTIGGFEGQRVQFRRASGWTETCPNSLGPAVVLFTDDGATPERSVWIDDQTETAWIVDVDGTTVIVHVTSAPSLMSNDLDVETVQPFVDSIRFVAQP